MRRTFLAKTFAIMGAGMAVTGITTFIIFQLGAEDPALFLKLYNYWFFILIIQMLLGFAIAAASEKLEAGVNFVLFMVYSAMTGLWFAPLLVVYEIQTVAYALVATLVIFLVMAVLALFTKIDFSKIGGILLFLLLAIIIISFINFFVYWFAPELATNIYWGVTYVSVGLFSLLAAWNIQELKKMSETKLITDENENRYAVVGAFGLYLNIINLFLALLRIFGRSS